MIEAIYFDFSETLVHGVLDIDACRRSVAELLRSKGHQVNKAQYDLAIEASLVLRRAAKLEGREMSFEEIERNTLKSLAIEPTTELISEIEDLEFEKYTWHLLPGVRRTVAELVQQFKLAIISNSASDSVIRVLKKENLALFFDAVVLSKDVGFRKPDSRIFKQALYSLGVAAEDALYIGDSFVQDVLGAKKTGMKTIWLTEACENQSSDFDAVARSISEVPGLIERLQGEEDRSESGIQAEMASIVRAV